MSIVTILLELLKKFDEDVRFKMDELPDYLEEMKDDLKYYPTYFGIVEENGEKVLDVHICKIREKAMKMFKLANLCR